MAQATSPSLSLQDGQGQNDHNPSNMKSNPEVPIDPSIAQTSPTYPQYSPYGQGHDMSHYPQGQPQPGHYYPQHYAGHPQGFPGAYSSPGTGVSASAAGATAGPRGQVGFWISLTSIYLVKSSILTHRHRYTHLSRSLVLNSTNALGDDMKRLRGCTSVAGKAVRRRMEH